MTRGSSSVLRPISNRVARIDRRGFLGVSCVAAGAVLAGCTIPPRSFRAPAGNMVSVPLKKYPELTRPGGVLKVRMPKGGVFYIRREHDSEDYLAVSGICTHQGCTVGATRFGFRCPCHGSTYDKFGKNTGGPAPKPLQAFKVGREGDQVVVNLTRRRRMK